MSQKSTTNFMFFAILVVAVFSVFMAYKHVTLTRAHSSLERYAQFRGCSSLVTKTENDATCRLPSGEMIHLIQTGEQWYEDGDLPCGFLCF